MGVCSAPNCNSNCRNGVRLFSFPADRDRRRRWVINCRRDKWTPTASSRLCERHFEESQFEANRKDGWRKLRPDAVPTIFDVPNPPQLFLSSCCPLKRRALVDEEQPKKVFLHDHCYAARTISRRNSDELSSGAEQSSTLRDISPQSRTEIDVTMPVSRIDSHPVCHVEDLKYNCLEYEVKTSHPSPRMHVALRNEVKILRTREQKYIADIRRMKRQLKNTQKMLTNATNNMKKFLTPDQIHQLMSGSSRGRKWSSATVQRSLQVFFACGISGYNFLRSNGQPLPAPRTLRHKIEGIKFENGILMEVFSMMSLKIKTMQEKEKDCSLTIDEMSISSSTEYDIRTGRIMGEVTLPGHSGKATHAMVFMLAGITTRWKQTVAYYFSGNSVFGTVLKPIVCNIIQKASEIGLNVLNITTDMGACNQAMWRSFGISCGRMQKTENRIVHPADSSKYLYFLADAPHVIKNLKASLINGQNILLPDWIVAVAPVECFYRGALYK